jgi:L-iditol 2-dehydrogenase
MRVARLHAAVDIRLADEPVPEVGPGHSLVHVTAVGICGSDLHWWSDGGIGDAHLAKPLVLGHENAGVIVTGPNAGQRVAIDPAIPCETCQQCRNGYRNLCPAVQFAGHGNIDGGMREFMIWPTALLHRLPDRLTACDGAMLEPLGVAAHCIDLGHLRLGGTAAVVGCGPIGLLVIQLLRLTGAARILAIEPLPHRRQVAAQLGADSTAGPAASAGLEDLTRGGADVVFELAGVGEAVQLAMTAAKPGGRVVLAGIPSDDRTTFQASVARRRGLTIAMARRMNDAYPRAIRLAGSGSIDLSSLVTHRFPLEAVAEAMQTAARRDGLKTMIEPVG